MRAAIRQKSREVIFLASLLVLFLCNAAGFIQFSVDILPDIALRVNFSTDTQDGFQAPRILTSPEFALLLITGLVLAMLLPLLSPIAASVLVLFLALQRYYIAGILAGSVKG